MRLWIHALVLSCLLAPIGAEEGKKKPNRVDFGFFGPGALNARHHPLLFSDTFTQDDSLIFGKIKESRPGAGTREKGRSSKKDKDKKKENAPGKARSYLVVCVERNGVKTYPVVDQERLQEKTDRNRDAKVTTVAGPFPDRKDAERKSVETLQEERSRAEARRRQAKDKP